MHAYADQDATGYISGSAGAPALTNLFPFNEPSGAANVVDMIGSSNLTTIGSPTSTSIVSSATTSGLIPTHIPKRLRRMVLTCEFKHC